MDRQTYIAKYKKTDRNLNIARLYFEEDKTIDAIREDYPELSRARIWKIAKDNKESYRKENLS